MCSTLLLKTLISSPLLLRTLASAECAIAQPQAKQDPTLLLYMEPPEDVFTFFTVMQVFALQENKSKQAA